MPEQAEGLMWGFRLWVSLPAAEKTTTPSSYLEPDARSIPEVHEPGGTVRVVAGEHRGRRGPAPSRATGPTCIDVPVHPGGELAVHLPDGPAAFAYLFDGEAGISGVAAASGQAAIMEGDGPARIASEGGGRHLVLAGRPLGEPMHRSGPFVMASERDLAEAFEVLPDGRFLASA